jgi:hypothetical protein
MHINFIVVALTSVIPLLLGTIWYHEKVMGKVWMQENGIDPQTPNSRSMPVILGFSLFLSFLLAVSLMPVTLHFMGLYSMLADEPTMKDPNSELSKTVTTLMTQHGGHFRTFKHGVLHGVLMTICMVFPTIAITAFSEKKSWKYIGVHVGYWAICLGLMGGIISAFA